MFLMWVKQCHKPPLEMVTIPPVKMVMTGGWFIIAFPFPTICQTIPKWLVYGSVFPRIYPLVICYIAIEHGP